jgi:hypothetical protein
LIRTNWFNIWINTPEFQLPGAVTPSCSSNSSSGPAARLVRLSAPLQLLPAAPTIRTKPVQFSQKTKFLPTLPGQLLFSVASEFL